MLEQRFEPGDRTQRTLFQLQRLYEHFGELAKARRMLEMLAEQRPRDPQMQRQLVQFYKQTQNEKGYIAALETQLATRYSEPACKELIGLYRGNGDFAAEQRTIADCRTARLPAYRRPHPPCLSRCRRRRSGRGVGAAALGRRSAPPEDRPRPPDVLYRTARGRCRPVEAQRARCRWLKGSKDDALVLQLIDNLATENRHDLAIDLAREVGMPGDSVSLAVAELLLDRDQAVAARSYLRGWLEAARLRDAELAQRLVAAALDADDPELAFRGAETFGLQRLGQGELVALAEALSAIGQVRSFQQVRRSDRSRRP